MRNVIACAVLLFATSLTPASAEDVCVHVGVGAEPPAAHCQPFGGEVTCVTADLTNLTPPVAYARVCVPKPVGG